MHVYRAYVFFAIRALGMDSEYFFHEGSLLYFFNTFILRVINADSFMSCKQNARFGCVALLVVMKGLFPLFY